MNKIEVLHNSKVVGIFNKLTATFKCGYSLKELLEKESQLAFVLEEGYLKSYIGKLFTKESTIKCPRFTIKFTLEGKDYCINKGALDSMDFIKTYKEVNLYKKIEGVGELVNPKEFPIKFIKNRFTVNV